jgi:hypothetical protein
MFCAQREQSDEGVVIFSVLAAATMTQAISLDYLIELYGWPKGSGANINQKFKGIENRAVVRAKLMLGDVELTADTAPNAEKVEFGTS